MFNTYPNHPEANHLVTLFSKVFNFVEFKEESRSNPELNFCITTYTAKTDDNWDLVIAFHTTKTSNADKKIYYPEIKFQQNCKSVRNFDEEQHKDRRKKTKALADFMQNTYKPEFERMINVLKIFVEKGIESGLFNSFDEKKYKKVMKSHVNTSHYSGTMKLSDNNFGTVTFNNILQKGAKGYNGIHFKKSYVSVSVDYFAHSDNTMHPYFKIRLPYSESRKSTCVIPFSGKPIVYFISNDDKLKKHCIDTLPSIPMEESLLKDFFDKEFHNAMIVCISKTLNMDKSQLAGVTPEELKEYFVLVEMMKV